MRTAALLLALLVYSLFSLSLPAQAQPPAQPPKPAAPAPQPASPRPAATRATMTVLVTDRQGDPIPDVEVTAVGAADRDGTTDANGNVALRNLGAGTYRLRFEHPSFVTFEKEVSMQAGRALRTTAALSPAPAPPPPPEEPAEPPQPPAPALPPPGSQPPTSLSIPDVFERNYVGANPSRVSPVGCAGAATATLIQLREPLAEHAHDDADEALYVVAGEGTQRLAGVDMPLKAGTLAMVPRGTPHTLTRRGSKPLVLLSILSGPPCTAK